MSVFTRKCYSSQSRWNRKSEGSKRDVPRREEGRERGVKLSDKTGSCGMLYKRSFTKPLEVCGKT